MESLTTNVTKRSFLQVREATKMRQQNRFAQRSHVQTTARKAIQANIAKLAK